jgi:hypothetical protein
MLTNSQDRESSNDAPGNARTLSRAFAGGCARALSLLYRTTAVKNDKTLTFPERSYFSESPEHPKTSYFNTTAQALAWARAWARVRRVDGTGAEHRCSHTA